MWKKLILCVLALHMVRADDCQAATACKAPLKDFSKQANCFLIPIFTPQEIQMLLSKVAASLCKGEDKESLKKDMISIVGSVSPAKSGKSLNALMKFKKCLEAKGKDPETVIDQIAEVIQSTAGYTVDEAQPQLKKISGCDVQACGQAAGKMICSRVGSDFGAKFMKNLQSTIGKDSLQCAVETLDKDFVYISKYGYPK